MKILITGAFGNVGKATIEESCKRGHEIIVFEVDNKKTRKDTRKYRNKIGKVLFGDIRNFEDVKKSSPTMRCSCSSCSNNSSNLEKTPRTNNGC